MYILTKAICIPGTLHSFVKIHFPPRKLEITLPLSLLYLAPTSVVSFIAHFAHLFIYLPPNYTMRPIPNIAPGNSKLKMLG